MIAPSQKNDSCHEKGFKFFHLLFLNGGSKYNKISGITDPLGKTHSLAVSEHCFSLKFVLFCYSLESGDGRTYGRTTMVCTGRDCGSAERIKMNPCLPQPIWCRHSSSPTRRRCPRICWRPPSTFPSSSDPPPPPRFASRGWFCGTSSARDALTILARLLGWWCRLEPLHLQQKDKTCVSSMIHSARPTVPPVVITILAWTLFCFVRFWKVETTDWRTDNTNSDHYQL